MRVATSLVVVMAFVLLGSASAHAAEIHAATCERSAVATAVNSANDGDTVVIPAGRCTWTTNLTIKNKILTIQGVGIDKTTIVDGVSKGGYPNVPQVLSVETKDGGLTRITGITFQGGSIADSYNKGMVAIGGTSKSWRLDHCRFVTTMTFALNAGGFTHGVIDHNIFDLADWKFGIYTFHGSWNGQGPYGDGSWADATYLGTERAIYIEDNVFNAPSLSVAHDGWSGGRVVFRHNTLNNTVYENHGTESGGRWRGQRSFEVYNNKFTHTGPAYASVVGLRSGVGVVFNNTATFDPSKGFIRRVVDAVVYRASKSFSPWGKCDGTSRWDGNQQPGGYPCLDQIGRGRGTLISGDDPTPVQWPQQLVEPTYAWNNMLNGALSPMTSNTPSHIVEGRDFFNASRPGYSPYTYPHPLATGASQTTPGSEPTSTLAAPGNLQIR